MKSKNVFGIWFSAAMCLQLFSLSIAKENNTSAAEIVIVEVEDNTKPILIEKQIEKQKIIEVKHLSKPDRYKLSKVGKDFIKSKETCALHAYNDPDAKRRSVGWGHQIRPGENLEHITQKKADELFEKDIEWVNDAINRLISQNDNRFVYSQGFIDGLGSLIYNCGERGVTLTEFYTRWQKCRYDNTQPGYINSTDLSYTISAVKTARISSPGHIERRYDEHLMMLN